MEYICGYFDTQGFYVSNAYHPVEAVMSGDHFLWQCHIGKFCKCCPTSSERSQISYLTENHHGLEFNKVGASMIDLKELMVAFYRGVKSKQKFLIACRSRESEMFLSKCNVPFININHMYGASFAAITKGRKPCILHKNESVNMKCSLNIVQDMETFVKDKMLQSKL